jgi:hypothetical protein
MNKKLLFVTLLVFLFIIVVIVWYVFYASPTATPSLSETNNPLRKNELPVRFQFIGTDGEDDQTSTTEVVQTKDDPFVRVWDKPTTGQFYFIDQTLREETLTTQQGTTTVESKQSVRATTTILLFVDRGTGYIYGYSPEENTVFQVTNTVVAGVYDAYIFNKGKRVIMRYKDGTDSGVLGITATIPNISPSGEPSPLENLEYLNSEVTSVAVDSLGVGAAYAVRTESGSSFYSISSGAPVLIASSPFGEWDLSFGGTALYGTSKPSSYAMGVTVTLPSFRIVIGERAALMTKPSSSFFVGSSWVPGGISTFLISPSRSTSLSLKTLASKCGWGSSTYLLCAVPETLPLSEGVLPDDWFKGLVRFSDSLVEVDAVSGEESPFFSFEEKFGTFDVTSITFSPDDSFISFINKNNGELWMIKQNLLPIIE